VDALGSADETRGWIDFAFEANYINKEQHIYFNNQYGQLNAMLCKLIENWENFK
jgi:four helix bundle protein